MVGATNVVSAGVIKDTAGLLNQVEGVNSERITFAEAEGLCGPSPGSEPLIMNKTQGGSSEKFLYTRPFNIFRGSTSDLPTSMMSYISRDALFTVLGISTPHSFLHLHRRLFPSRSLPLHPSHTHRWGTKSIPRHAIWNYWTVRMDQIYRDQHYSRTQPVSHPACMHFAAPPRSLSRTAIPHSQWPSMSARSIPLRFLPDRRLLPATGIGAGVGMSLSVVAEAAGLADAIGSMGRESNTGFDRGRVASGSGCESC